jgi:hypothetical protein
MVHEPSWRSTGPRLRSLTTAGIAALAVLVAVVGCSKGRSAAPATSAPAAAPVAVSTQGTLSAAERLYGSSATADSRVRYQPAVVLIHRGASAVKSVAADGLSWTMDGGDPDVAKLQVGSIMLATSLGTGRVAAISHVGSDVQVILVPVSLTDVLADGDISSTQPLALSAPLYYSTPDRPGLVEQQNTASPSATPSVRSFSSAARQPAVRLVDAVNPTSIPWPVHGPMLPPVTNPTAANVDNFSALPICCSGSTGLNLTYNQDGARLIVRLELQVSRPSVNFHLKISGGHLDDASVSLNGASGVKITIEAATVNSAANFRSPSIEIPVSITFPLFGTPIPMTATITQAFNVSLQLGGAAYFKTHGSFALEGTLGFGLTNGQPHADAATLSSSDSLLGNIESASIAASALSLHWGLRASVGIGVQGFTAGAWYQLTTGLALDANGITSGNLDACVEGSVDVNGSYGVGYSIPKVVASIVNAFLTLLHTAPIAASGGPSWGPTLLWRVPLAKRCHLRAP